MNCPACGSPDMGNKVLDETLSYGGQSLTLHAMRGEFCASCGEGVWDVESYRRYTEAQAGLLRTVKGDVGDDIRRIRKKLNLTQTELSKPHVKILVNACWRKKYYKLRGIFKILIRS